jgi:hypothetical protein
MGASTALMFGFAPQEASALSCMRPDLIKTLEEAKASEKIYHIFVGKFKPELTAAPGTFTNTDGNKTPFSHSPDHYNKQPRVTRARFSGFSLASNPRYDYPLTDYPVNIDTSCAGPWCGSLPGKQQEVIAFVEAQAGQYPVLRVTPCPDKVHPVRPKDNQIKKVRSCLGRTCQTQQHDYSDYR